jgi:hypothetical protein
MINLEETSNNLRIRESLFKNMTLSLQILEYIRCCQVAWEESFMIKRNIHAQLKFMAMKAQKIFKRH